MRTKWRSSIGLKLALFVGGLVIISATILIWTSYTFARSILVNQINERLTEVTTGRQALLLAYVEQQLERVSLVASRTRLRQLLEAHADGQIDQAEFRSESQRILLDAQEGTEDFRAILIVGLDGKVVTATSDEYWKYDFSDENAFIQGLENTYLGVPQAEGSGYWTFLSGPAIANNGRLLGVVIVELDLNVMEMLARERTALGESGELLIGTRVGEQVNYLFPPRHAPDLKIVTLDQIPAMSRALAGEIGFLETVDYRDVVVLAAYRPVTYLDWGVVAKIDVAEAYVPIEDLRTRMLIIGGLILLFGLGFASVLARQFSQPISHLTTVATAFGAGDLQARVRAPAGTDELSQLSQIFDEMADTVQHGFQALEERVQERTEQLSRSNEALEAEVAERRRAQAELAKNADALRRSNTELEQYAYIASHDLQEPLRMVRSYVEFLALDYEGQLDEKADRYIKYAVDGATRMKILIDDLLAFSRIDKQAKPFQPTDCNEIMEEVARNLSATIAETGAVVSWSDLPTLDADGTQLAQLFQNLVNNGIKYCQNKQPRVSITVSLLNDDQDSDSGATWQFAVRDNGIGIEPQHHERIFKMFERLHHRDEYSGTGIGLAICHKIVQRHGGSIWVESAASEGSTFFFTLVAGDKELVQMSESNQDYRVKTPLEILLVDDNPGDVELTQRILQASRYELNFTAAEDGEVAMEILRNRAGEEAARQPDLILLDLKMPRMNGYQMLDALNDDPQLKNIPVMVLTSTTGEMETLFGKGIHPSSYCSKPISVERFNHFASQIGQQHVGALASMNISAESESEKSKWWWPFGKGS